MQILKHVDYANFNLKSHSMYQIIYGRFWIDKESINQKNETSYMFQRVGLYGEVRSGNYIDALF